MVKLAEHESGKRIEDAITTSILGDERIISLDGIAVTVMRINPAATGIAKTAQSVRTPVLETNLRNVKYRTTGKGVIFAIDTEHNALWLRPQRLTSTAMDRGFLVVAGFVQDALPAYSVTVREQGWRDGEIFEGLPPSNYQKYVLGGMPDLLEQDWERLGTQVPASPSEAA
jgi:hypothetical protein